MCHDWTIWNCDGVFLGKHGTVEKLPSDYLMEVVFENEDHLPMIVPGFRCRGPECFEHAATGLQVRAFSAASWHWETGVFETLRQSATAGVASLEGCVAARLQRLSLQDKEEIERILQLHPDVCLHRWPLSQEQVQRLSLMREKANER